MKYRLDEAFRDQGFFQEIFWRINLYVLSPRNLGTYILVRNSGEVTPPAVQTGLIAANNTYFVLP